MKKARAVAGMMAIPAAVGGLAVPATAATAHATQAREPSARQAAAGGKSVRLHDPHRINGARLAPLSHSETLFYRSGGSETIPKSWSVWVSCYYSGAPNKNDPYWDHVTSERFGFIVQHKVGHLEDRYVDFEGKLAPSAGIPHCP